MTKQLFAVQVILENFSVGSKEVRVGGEKCEGRELSSPKASRLKENEPDQCPPLQQMTRLSE